MLAIDVRISQVDRHAVAMAYYLLRQIDVVIKRDHHRNIRPYASAYPPQQLTLGIGKSLGAHGAMQVEIDRINRHGLRQHADQLADDTLKAIVRDVTTGTGMTPDQWHQIVSGTDLVEKPRHAERRVAGSLDDLWAARQRRKLTTFSVVIIIRAHGHEAVSLV